ncbi:hypothetical protein NDU88_008686 [Pleurodeles waltl]|uniref:Uncharacterized protein n=1 Tax=Pleurodeles waltl TaxID=8319 RepID=A0AAV7PWW0_PLEWA|nr:hypothetical protein NDU88_008686 [Pleurodeles waltl]
MEPKGDACYRDTSVKRSPAVREEVLSEECTSLEQVEEVLAPAMPKKMWSAGSGASAQKQGSTPAGELAPEADKRGSLGRPYMVTRAPGLASMIPLQVKERIWRREFIDIFSLLEIQVEGLDLTTIDKKEEKKRERNRVRRERNFDNWLDVFRVMACIIVEKFPHCAKHLWLFQSKIHKV